MTDAPSARPASELLEYRSLYKYLENRFADTVVLTFAQIEALLGFTLPALARLVPAWWANLDETGSPSPQSASWTQASRSATANLRAESVTFERNGS